MLTTDLDVEVEEWAIRYRALEDSLQQEEQQQERQQEDADNSTSTTTILLSKALIARAGRLGALQRQQAHPQKGQQQQQQQQQPQQASPAAGHWQQARLEMTQDTVQTYMDQCLQTLATQQVSERTANHRHTLTAPTANTACPQTTDVDAFFEEYSECIRPGWKELIMANSSLSDDEDDSSTSSDDADQDENIENHHANHRNGDTSKSKRNPQQTNHKKKAKQRQQQEQQQQQQPLHQAMEAQERQRRSPPPLSAPPQVSRSQQQQQQHQPPSTRPTSAQGRPTNPYQKQQQQQPYAGAAATAAAAAAAANSSRIPKNAAATAASAFEYPQTSRKDSSWDQQHAAPPAEARRHHPQQQQQQWPAVRASHHQSFAGASWDEHTNQQNPFFTAREMAQIMAKDDQHEPPPRQQQRGQQRGDGNINNYNYQNQQHASDNMYANSNGYYSYPQQQPNMVVNGTTTYPEDEEVAPRGGPSIPNSLRRKFQPPKRGSGGAEPGNHNPNNNNNHNNNTGNRKPSGLAPSKGGGVKNTGNHQQRSSSSSGRNNNSNNGAANGDDDEELPEELQHLDKELVKKIQNEIMEAGDTVTFDDIAGLADAKQTVQEVVCWPMKRPDLFTGLRRAPNGLLLYGPPGTGKTLIGKAIAHESGATFFSISSSSLTSKWIGEGEKLVKTLFAVAGYREPAVVFIDEIDSLLTQRKSTENEASRRIKTEFLVQLDGTGTSGQGRVLVIGATNKPQELDEAARRRFTKRLYIPLPCQGDRRILLHVMLKKNNHQLTDADIDRLAKDTNGFSGADLKALCTDAAMGPIRQLGPRALEVRVSDVPPITYKHFKRSLKGTKPSVAPSDLVQYEDWDKVYGTKRATEEDDDDDDEE